MNQILDENEVFKDKEVIDKRVNNPLRTAAIYLALILVGNFSCAYFGLMTAPSSESDIASHISATLVFTLFFLILSLLIESLKFFSRKFISKKYKNVILYLNPFWFQIIEAAFGMAIIIYAIVFLFFIINMI